MVITERHPNASRVIAFPARVSARVQHRFRPSPIGSVAPAASQDAKRAAGMACGLVRW